MEVVNVTWLIDVFSSLYEITGFRVFLSPDSVVQRKLFLVAPVDMLDLSGNSPRGWEAKKQTHQQEANDFLLWAHCQIPLPEIYPLTNRQPLSWDTSRIPLLPDADQDLFGRTLSLLLIPRLF